MRTIALIALREYLGFVLRRGFIISMLVLPAWIAISGLIPIWTERATPPTRFAIVDRSETGLTAVIDQALRAAHARETIEALTAYSKSGLDMEALERARPELAQWVKDVGEASDAVAALDAIGGIELLSTMIGPYARKGAPVFEAPRARSIRVEPAFGLNQEGEVFRLAAAAALAKTGAPDQLSGILVIPRGFGLAAPLKKAEYWSTGLAGARITPFLRDTLAQELRLRAIADAGVAADTAKQIQKLGVKIDNFDPSPQAAGGPVGWIDRLKTMAPLIMAGFLFVIVFVSSTMLLGSILEDKSNRVIEVVLSCATPVALMSGKIIGAGAAAMTIFALWFGAALGSLFIFPETAVAWRAALGAILTIDFLPIALVFFVLAFLIYSSLFLIVGSIARNPQDAQAYVGPLMLVVFLPFFFVGVVLVDPNGSVARTLTFVPLYTPFVTLIRLPYDPPQIEVLSALVLSVATAIGLIWLAGQAFARNAVQVEQSGPGLFKRLFGGK